MKLRETFRYPEEIERLLPRWIGIGVGLIVAILAAYWIGTQQIFLLAVLAAVGVIVAVAVIMRDRAWVLIPIGWVLTGTAAFLPLRLSIRDACILLAFCAYVTYAIVAQKSFRRKLHLLDVIIAVNAVWLMVTFVHHPVGIFVFGGENIGGRPYLEMFLALLAYRMLVLLPSSPKMVSWIPYFILAGTIIMALVNLVVYIAPSTTPLVYFFYRGVDIGSYMALGVAETGLTRWGQVGFFGMSDIFVLCALYPPRTLFNPLRPRFYALMLGLAAVLASGFRSFLLWVFVAIGLASWFHRGWRETVMGALAGALVLGALVIGQGRVYQLPETAQRALSWLPGEWSPVVLANAEESSESRFQWWKNIIKYDLIHDWWLGDGFGVSLSDLTLFQSGRDFFGWMTLVGGYHNGPLSSIRYTGIVGLILFYALMITAAIYSVKCVNRCRGTPLQMVAIFLAIQLVWQPFHYTLVFGGFDAQAPETIFLVGLLLLVMRMADKLKTAEAAAARPEPTSSILAPVAAGTP